MHIVKCRICKEQFDTDKEKDWVMPSTNWYYHLKCYENFGRKAKSIEAEMDDELWFQASWDFLMKDQKIVVDFLKMKSQWDNFLKKKMTAKGIYFCLRYFYDVKKGDKDKSEGGIGIIPYIYTEGCEYWARLEQREVGICQKIEEQLKQRFARDVQSVQRSKRLRQVKAFNFDEIEEEE